MVTLRATKGSPLTHNEVDANFTELSLRAGFTPQNYDAVADGSTDDTVAINDMTAAARATRSATWETRTAFMDLAGKAYKVTSAIDLTKFRTAIGHTFGNGVIHADMAGGAILDLTGSSSVILDNLFISTKGSASVPDYGIVMSKYKTSAGVEPVAPWHRAMNVIIEGKFAKAGWINYGSEDFAGYGCRITNKQRDLAAYCLIVQRNDDLYSYVSPHIDAPEAMSDGAASNIRRLFTNLRMGRTAPTAWAITAITKANPGVCTYTVGSTGITPVNGDVITLDGITSTGDVSATWVALLDNRIFTITNVNTALSTFELSATNTSGLTGTYDASSATVYYRSGPALLVNGATYSEFNYAYASVWGSHGFEVARGAGDIRGLKLHGHVEGDAIQGWLKFTTGTATFNVSDLDVYEHACHVHEDFFITDASGAGKVNLYSPRIVISSWRIDAATGEASGAMRGLMFDDPSKYFIYNAYLDIEQKAYMNPIEDFGHFSGRVHFRDTNETFVYGDVDQTDNVVLEDDFTGFALDTFKWQTLGGTHGSSAAAIGTSSNNSGYLLLTSGADAAATLAANGRQLNSRAIFRADSERLSCEFRVSMSAITTVAMFIGLTDQDTALEIPAVMAAGDAITPSADDFVGILFDTEADTDLVWCVARNAAGTSQKVVTDAAPITMPAAYTIWRLEINVDGDCEFYRDGTLVTTITDAILPTRRMAFTACHFSRAASPRDVRLDRVRISTQRHY